MTIRLTKTGRLTPILDNQVSSEIALSILKTGSFSEKEKPLVEVMIKIMEDGKPVTAETVFIYSKSIPLLTFYMAYVDAIDKNKFLHDI